MRVVLVLIYLLLPALVVGGVLWRYHWCMVADPAMKACRGEVAPLALRRCVPKSVPPKSELQGPMPAVDRAFTSCASRAKREGPEAVLPYLDSTLAVIEAEHGRNSPAYAAALTRVILLLAGAPDLPRSSGSPPEGYSPFARQTSMRMALARIPSAGRFDLIRPYSETAIAVSREVYGEDHRETAMALHIHADVLTFAGQDGHTAQAIPLLREAVEIRRGILGAEHVEMLVVRGRLAQSLFAEWRRTEGRQDSPLLDEAETLAESVLSGIRGGYVAAGFSQFSTEDVQVLLGRIAQARGNHEKAAQAFAGILRGVTLYSCVLRKEICKDYLHSLRELGRDEEAEKVEESLRKADEIQGKAPDNED